MKIKIWETDEGEGGYMFDIWLNENATEDEGSDDGGLCTGSYEEAIVMACEQAKDLLKIRQS